jgi:hypothetical protein
VALYAHNKDLFTPIKEAFDQNLPLIEICVGDYANPQYIAVTMIS